jgi:hypothetical protein
MNKSILTALALLALAAGARATELIVNGGFEQPLEVGWSDTVYQQAGAWLFERSDTCGQPGNVARVRKDLAAYAALVQTVDVPDVDLVFSYSGRFRIGGGSSTCWPAAALILRYLGSGGIELGNTKYVLHNEFCTWGNSDTAHIIEVENPEVWVAYNLEIAREIADNLPGVNAAQVAQIKVEIYSFDSGT